MTIFVTVLAAVMLLAAAPLSWLDAKTPKNWNVAGAVVPARPGPRDAELAAGGRCASVVRPAFAPEDRAVMRSGWSLVGAYHRYGVTSIVFATASADGMCRPDEFQGFVFVRGTFAGTLAPHPMAARTDGSVASLSATLFAATDVQVDFARYDAKDPMCCPHATSTVLYQVTTTAPPLVAPVSVTVAVNPPPG